MELDIPTKRQVTLDVFIPITDKMNVQSLLARGPCTLVKRKKKGKG